MKRRLGGMSRDFVYQAGLKTLDSQDRGKVPTIHGNPLKHLDFRLGSL
jgi:hypothetical protein